MAVIRAIFAATALMLVAACADGGAAASNGAAGNTAAPADAAGARATTVSIVSAAGTHRFTVEIARTPQEQQRGLMFRTVIPADGGMLFTPYPPAGGAPRAANFWMKDTPSPLDIVFIRADRTIARIAENTVPFSEAMIPSGEPVDAVLEINSGRAAELGIEEGDSVSWGK